jgi:hypothetical protein
VRRGDLVLLDDVGRPELLHRLAAEWSEYLDAGDRQRQQI